MVESITLDRIDRQLIHALKVDGRASFSRIGQVLGVSDQTVARRYQRLRADDAVRVVGVPGLDGLGSARWFVRTRCLPDAAQAVAAALAKRTDTMWVQLAAGGAEVTCVTQPESRASHETLLLQKLPRTPRIVDISAHQLLRAYEPDPLLFGQRMGGLDAAAVDQLRPPAADLPRGPLDGTDRAILIALGRDGRASLAELAATTGSGESTVRRRLTQLRRTGRLIFDVDLDNRLIGLASSVILELTVEPRALRSTAEALVRYPEVNFVGVMTGAANVLATVTCADGAGLYDFLTDRIGALAGVRQVASTPIQRVVKRHGQPW